MQLLLLLLLLSAAVSLKEWFSSEDVSMERMKAAPVPDEVSKSSDPWLPNSLDLRVAAAAFEFTEFMIMVDATALFEEEEEEEAAAAAARFKTSFWS